MENTREIIIALIECANTLDDETRRLYGLDTLRNIKRVSQTIQYQKNPSMSKPAVTFSARSRRAVEKPKARSITKSPRATISSDSPTPVEREKARIARAEGELVETLTKNFILSNNKDIKPNNIDNFKTQKINENTKKALREFNKNLGKIKLTKRAIDRGKKIDTFTYSDVSTYIERVTRNISNAVIKRNDDATDKKVKRIITLSGVPQVADLITLADDAEENDGLFSAVQSHAANSHRDEDEEALPPLLDEEQSLNGAQSTTTTATLPLMQDAVFQ